MAIQIPQRTALPPPTDTTRVARQLAMLGEDGQGALMAGLLEDGITGPLG